MKIAGGALVGVALAALAAAAWWAVGPHAPTLFPLDDAYLYHTFAGFLAGGEPFRYSAGEPHANGNTSFLYYLGLGVVHRVVGDPGRALLVTWILHAVAYVGSGVLFYSILLGRVARPGWACAGALAAFANGPMLFAFLSGIEGPLTVRVLLFVLAAFVAGARPACAAALCLAAVTRPEGWPLALGGALVLAVAPLGTPRGTIRIWALIAVAVVVVPGLSFLWTGVALPNSVARTGLREAGGAGDLLGLLRGALAPAGVVLRAREIGLAWAPWARGAAPWGLVASAWVAVGAALVALGCVRRKLSPADRRVLLLAGLWLVIPIGLGEAGEFGRYTVVVTPLLLYLAWGALADRGPRPALAAAGLAATVIAAALSAAPVLGLLGDATRFLRALHFETALALRHDPSVRSVAVWETGVLSLFCAGDKRVIDVYGLGTTRYARTPRAPLDAKAALLARDRADVLVQWGDDPYQGGLVDALERAGVGVEPVASRRFEGLLRLWAPDYPRVMSVWRLVPARGATLLAAVP